MPIIGDPSTTPFARNQAWSKPAPPGGYLTKLKPDEEAQFKAWVTESGAPFDPSPDADYDMRGFWQALSNKDPRATTAVNPNDRKMHFPDVWKTPYHQSFSAESQWAMPNAPTWNDKDQLVTRDGKVLFDEKAIAAKALVKATKAQ